MKSVIDEVRNVVFVAFSKTANLKKGDLESQKRVEIKIHTSGGW